MRACEAVVITMRRCLGLLFTTEPADETEFRRNKAAWKFFEAQPPSYRHLVSWWIMTTKRTETRKARLAKLILASKSGQRL